MLEHWNLEKRDHCHSYHLVVQFHNPKPPSLKGVFVGCHVPPELHKHKMKHLPSQVMLNSTNVNYTNPTLKNVLLPITKKKGTLFHLYSVCLVSCAKIPNTCYTHVYIYNYMYIYIYNTYTLCIDIIVPFRTFVLATNTDKMIHCHILLMHWFSRFWRGSQSSINGMMNFRARRGWFGHLGKRSCFRCRGFFWCGRDVRFPWRGRRWLQFLGRFLKSTNK